MNKRKRISEVDHDDIKYRVERLKPMYILVLFLIITNGLNGFVLSDQVDRFTISSFVGDGNEGNTGDNGPPNHASIGYVEAIEVASNGDLYIADKSYHRIRKVSNGIMHTIAGTGNVGAFSGDGALATAAKLNKPLALAFYNVDGTLYIGDSLNYRIRKISNLIISTVIGKGTKAALTPGTATDSYIGQVLGMAVSSSGVLYFSDYTYSCIGKISGTTVSVAAGTCATFGYSGDNGIASSAKLNGPNGIAISPTTGELFIADSGNNVIRKVGLDNKIHTVVGTGVIGSSGDGGQAALATLNGPSSIAFTSNGEMLISDNQNYVIRKVYSNGIIRTIAGSVGISGYSGDGQDSLWAQTDNIYSITYSNSTNELFIADSANFRVRKLTSTRCGGVLWSNSSVCSSFGVCSYMDNCDCSSGYSGNVCQNFYCFSIEKDTPSACFGQGKCISPNNCSCFDNNVWTGRDCGSPVCFGKVNGENVCNNHGNCSSPNACSCNANWIGNDCGIPKCFDIPANFSTVCSGRGSCVNANTCSCKQNYYGDNCQYFDCNGIRYDNSSVCTGHGVCESPNNCSCTASYYSADCSSFDCFGIEHLNKNSCSSNGKCSSPNNCSCKEGYYGDVCGSFKCFSIEHNSSNVCSANGECNSPNNCTCSEGYYGNNCEFYSCYGLNESDASVCSYNGLCISPNNCSCLNQHYGLECEMFDCFGFEKSVEDVCSRNGVCSMPNNCTCSEEFYGEQCEKFNCFSIENNSTSVCSSNGLCISPNNCSCLEGYYGANCQYFDCFQKSENDSSVCSYNGICSGPNNCSCSNGYYGMDCSLFDCFGHSSNSTDVCSGNGKCESTNNCNCKEGFFGPICNEFSCFGYPSNNSLVCSSFGKCSDYNNCSCYEGFSGENCELVSCFGIVNTSNEVCSGHGLCNNPNQCSCFPDYFGESCEQFHCFGVSNNNSNVCSGNGKCISVNECNCTSSGYFGNDCEMFTCFEINRNSSFACSTNGTCVAPDNCSCLNGFYGLECEQFNCFGISKSNATTCNSNGECIGPDMCHCENGYGGLTCTNYSCFDIPFNNEDVCSSNGVCDSPNNCSCNEGFYGANCNLFDCFGISSKSFNVCSNGQGSCKSPNSCNCRDGYYGPECEGFYCFGVKHSNVTTCSGRGECKQLNSCSCHQDETNGFWNGEQCNQCLPPYFGRECKTTPCSSPSSCSYHGECKLNGSCVCYADQNNGFWKGEKCEKCMENYYGTKCQLSLKSGLRFSDFGNKILLETNSFVPSSRMVDCAKVVFNHDVLGSISSCEWENSTFLINLGEDFSLRPDQLLYINLEVLGEGTNGSFVEMKVNPPLSSEPPIAKIEKFSICDDFILDSSKSASRDAKPLYFQWSVLSSKDYAVLNPLVQQANNESSKTIRFKYSDYSKGQHIFKLTVKSTLFNTESEAIFTLDINYDPQAPIFVNSKVVSVSEVPIVIKKNINPNCLAFGNFSYTSIYTKTDGPPMSFTLNNLNNLVISSYSTLRNSLYSFKIDFKGRNEYLIYDYSTTFNIETRISELDLKVVAMEASSTRYVLAYSLTDLDNVIEKEQAIWSCHMNGESCSWILNTLDSTSSVTILKPDNQNFWNTPIDISLSVGKGFRNASSSIQISFPLDPKFGIPPVINALYRSVNSKKVKQGEILNIQVGIQGVEDSNRIQRIWRLNGVKIDPIILKKMRSPLSDSNSIIIDTQYLDEGDYILTLRVDDELTWLSSTFSDQFTILKFPKPCSCFVTPFGFALSTEFTFRCPNCETESTFAFEYGYIDDYSGLKIPIASSSLQSFNKSASQYLPGSSSKTLEVYIKIIDLDTETDMTITTSVGIGTPEVNDISVLQDLISEWTRKASQEKQDDNLGQNVFNSATISSVVTMIKDQLMSNSSRRIVASSNIDTLIEELKTSFITSLANAEINRMKLLNPLTVDSVNSFVYTGFSLVNSVKSLDMNTLSLLMYATEKFLSELYSNKNIIIQEPVEKLLSGFISLLFDNSKILDTTLKYDSLFLRFSIYLDDLLKRSMILGSEPFTGSNGYASITSNKLFSDELSSLTIISNEGKAILPQLSLTSVKPWSYSLHFINNRAIFSSKSSVLSETKQITKINTRIKSKTTYLSIINSNNQEVELKNLTEPIKFVIPLNEQAGFNYSNIVYNYECKMLVNGKIANAPSCLFSLLDNSTGLCTCFDNVMMVILETQSEIILKEEVNPVDLPATFSYNDIIWIPLTVMACLIVILIISCGIYVIIGCCKREKKVEEKKPEMHYKNFALNQKFAKKLVKVGEVDLEENPLDSEWELQEK